MTKPTPIDLSEFTDTPRFKCKVSSLIESLDDVRRERVTAALAEPGISNQRISSVLKGWGLYVSEEAVRRHRLEVCPCQ